jgi:hypothetical protein
VERAIADVKEMLATSLSENNSTQWSEGLIFLDKEHKNKINCSLPGHNDFSSVIMLAVNSRPLSLCRIIGAPNMRNISKRLYVTSAAVFDFNGRTILNL